MKLQAMLPAVLFAAVSTLSVGAYAADAEKTPASEVQADKTPVKKMKPHSHLKEKTGIDQNAPAAAADSEKSQTPKADKDKSKHFHPRDSK